MLEDFNSSFANSILNENHTNTKKDGIIE